MSTGIDFAGLPDRSRHSLELDVTTLPDGSTLRVPVDVIAGAGPSPCLVLVAGIHGDEGEGILALTELWDELDPAAVKGRVILVTCANPPAFGAHRRRSPLDELDLNRIFPGKPEGSPSERLADRLFQAVLRRADFVFSLHSWYASGAVLPYVEFKHDCPTGRASLEAAAASGFELVRISTWSPGLMTRVANEAGIPGIEAEIGGGGVSLPENRERYKRHVRALMAHLGMTSGAPAKVRPRLVDHVDMFAPAGGVLRVRTRPGAELAAGDVLGTIQDFRHRELAELRAPDKALVGAIRTAASVQPGELVFRLFRDVTLSL